GKPKNVIQYMAGYSADSQVDNRIFWRCMARQIHNLSRPRFGIEAGADLCTSTISNLAPRLGGPWCDLVVSVSGVVLCPLWCRHRQKWSVGRTMGLADFDHHCRNRIERFCIFELDVWCTKIPG